MARVAVITLTGITKAEVGDEEWWWKDNCWVIG